jgi:hypothetical protein
MKPARVRPMGLILPMILALLAGPAVAPAAEDFPIRPVALTNWGGDLYMSSHYQSDDETRGAPGVRTRNEDLYLEEGVNLDFAGYIYHPNMVEWRTDLRLGLSQQDITTGGASQTSLGTLLGYNINLLALKEKSLSGRVYATRDQEFVDRTFGRPIDYTTETEGGELALKGAFPGILLYEHRTLHEISDIRNDDLDASLVRFELADARSRDFDSHLRFEHEDIAETSTFFASDGTATALDLPQVRDELNFSNNYAFDGGRERLTGTARLLNRSGFFSEQLASLEERLDITHSPTFATYYHALVSSDTSDSERNQVFEGEAGFTQKVFRSLDISGRLLASDEVFGDGSQQRYEGYLDFDYRKRTPIGLYTSGLDVGLAYQTEQFPQGVREIANSPVTLNGVAPTQLSQPNILTGSIAVTDINHVPIPPENYLISSIGQFTELTRVPGGLIADGQPLLVSYSAAAGRNSQYLTDALNWRHRLALKGLPVALYGEYHLRTQSLTSGDDPGTLENENELLGGAELTLGPLVVNGEYEYHTFRFTPSFDAYRGRATYVKVLGQRTNFNAGANYEMLRYLNGGLFALGPGRGFLETYGAYASVNTKLTQTLLLRCDASYYHSAGRRNDSLAKVGAAVTYSRGKFDLSVNSSFGYFTQESDHGISAFVGMTLRRQF